MADVKSEDDYIKNRRKHLEMSCEKKWGLALSGGGIRSATFSLGVLQAMADLSCKLDGRVFKGKNTKVYKDSFLAKFDYLSTVSGGGYIGGFLSSLFLPERMLDSQESSSAKPDQCGALEILAANKGVEILSNGPPGRTLEGGLNFPLNWLRNNGRYLMPNGVGDYCYASAIALRNIMAIHYVVGSILVFIFGAIIIFSEFAVDLFGSYSTVKILSHPTFNDGTNYSLLVFLDTISVIFGISVGVSYWYTYWKEPILQDSDQASVEADTGNSCAETTQEEVAPIIGVKRCEDAIGCYTRLSQYFIAGCALLIGAVALMLSSPILSSGLVEDIKHLLMLPGTILAVSSLVYFYALFKSIGGNGWSRVQKVRVDLTRTLCNSLFIAMGMILVTLMLFAASVLIDKYKIILGSLVSLVSLPVILKFGLNLLSTSSENVGLKPDKVLPVLGVALAGVFVLCWAVVAVYLFDHILQSYKSKMIVIAVVFFASWVAGIYGGFINLSSLQPFYSGRLGRSYLGATNKNRSKTEEGLSASEPIDGDDIELSELKNSIGPLHIINITLCQTTDATQQLVQRDRKGKSLAVTAFGYSIDGQKIENFKKTWNPFGVNSELTLGQWLGVSGAAFSTAVGRQSSFGLSLLMGLANIRLGIWWDLGVKNNRFFDYFFRVQGYLLDEFTCKFRGENKDWVYLTDGGHYENTGVLELLRENRDIEFILAVDSGADPNYDFDDVANLIRLARIDLQIELTDCSNLLSEQLKENGGSACTDITSIINFRKINTRRSKGIDSNCNPSAILFRATYLKGEPQKDRFILFIKPSVVDGMPDDCWQYKVKNSDFPQEKTADQFFDEAQWESYRNLGFFQTMKIFQSESWRCMENILNFAEVNHAQ